MGVDSKLMLKSARLPKPAPIACLVHGFPALYWPYKAKPGVANYLYYSNDAWRFTLIWTLLLFASFHAVVAIYAILMQVGKGKSAWQYVWIIPLAYAFVAGIEAVLAGSIIGLM